MELGAIVEGKVTGITKFGAFVALEDGKSGMVHISEVAHSYVSDINDHLTVGQTVKAKIIAMENGKINLSIKQCTEAPQRQSRSGGQNRNNRTQQPRRDNVQKGNSRSAAADSGSSSFDDMLKRFMADSDSKLSSVRQYSDHRTKRRRS